MQVQNGQHVDTPLLRMEVYAIGKVMEQRTVHLVFRARKLSGIVYDPTEHLVEFFEEPRSQAGPLVFVPDGSSLNVEVGFWLDNEPPCHPSDQRSCNLRSMSVRTSVQSRPALGFVLYATKRSRMICRCHSGTGAFDLMRVTGPKIIVLSYEPEGTLATEEADAVGGWQSYLVRKVALLLFLSL